ncbi:MAG TPA: hypothetical protein PLG48_00005 [Candidatus Avimonas sp.]|nr:YdeI/OmpD-associated family protein [Clostridiales bacterium]HPU57875.1 hypothetical protein [Candidatus Avimonas sp.]
MGKSDISFGNDLPLGFGMALAQNPGAMSYFASLSDEEKRKIIEGTRSIKSKQEMRAYVDNLASSQQNSFQ